jgi:glycerophosphoryl diester phosphodiesterase
MTPLVIAHRGASAYEPENTLRAFDLAIQQGAQMIELDLHRSRDNRIIVIHDPTLNHSTDRRGWINNLPLSEIKQADAGKGERIPTLEETLDLSLGKVRLYLEIKDPTAATETLRIIRDRRCEDQVMLASFNLRLMRELGERIRDIELGLILGTPSLSPYTRWRETFPWFAFRQINYQVLCLQVSLCYRYLAHQTHVQGKRLFVWTANNSSQFARAVDHQVDGIVTNYPDCLVQYLNGLK